MRRRSAFPILLMALMLASLVELGAPTVAHANPDGSLSLWAQRAYSATRSARVTLSSQGDLSVPRLLLRFFAGDAVEEDAAVVGELNGEPGLEHLGLERGRVVALNADLSLLWDSADVSARRLLQVRDFDGDGDNEILVEGGGRLLLINGQSGELDYSLGYEGGGFKVADLDGNGSLELIVRDDGAFLGLRVFDFSQGVEAGRLMWQISEGLPSQAFGLTIGDVAAEVGVEVVFTDDQGAHVVTLAGADGRELRRSDARPIDGDRGCGPSVGANLDDDPEQELILTGARATGNQSAFVAVYDFGEDQIRWSYEYGARGDQAEVRLPAGLVGDMDGDGDVEVVVSVFDNGQEILPGGERRDEDGIERPGAWTLAVYDAATGDLEASAPDRVAVAVAPLGPQGAPVLLAQVVAQGNNPGEGSALEVLEVVDGALEPRGAFERTRLASAHNPEGIVCGREGALPQPVHADFDDDGTQDLVVLRDLDGQRGADLVQLLSLAGGRARILASASLAPTLGPARVISAGRAAPGQEAHLVMDVGDGQVTTFNSALEPTQRRPLSRFEPEPRSVITFVGEDEQRLVLLQDERGTVRAVDMEGDEALEAAVVTRPGVRQPMVTLFRQGRSSMARVALDNEQNPRLSALDPVGNEVWGKTFNGAVSGPRSLLADNFNTLAGDDLAYLYEDAQGALRVETVDGGTGEVVASRRVDEIQQETQGAVLVAADFGSSNNNIVLLARGRATVLQVPDLTVLRSVVVPEAPHSVVDNFTSDPLPDLLVNGLDERKVLIDLTTGAVHWEIAFEGAQHPWTDAGETFPGVIGRSDGGLDAVFAGRNGELTRIGGRSGQVVWRVCLSQGEVTELDGDLPPVVGDCDGAPLSDVTVANFTAAAVGDELLVGSRDGFVYALDGTGGLLWSMDMGAPVGAPAYTDIQGDNIFSILVPTLTGNLFKVGEGVRAPAEVRDVRHDGFNVVEPGADVDEVEQDAGLGVAWERVQGADGYRLGIFGDDGTLVALDDRGDTNTALLTELPVRIGATYHAVVTAYVNQDAGQRVESPAVISDGIRLVDLTAPEALDFLAEPVAFNPRRDGAVALTASLSDNFGLAGFELVARLEGQGEPAWVLRRRLDGAAEHALEESFDGMNDAMEPLADGRYTIELVARDQGDNEARAEVEVTLDATAPDAPVWLAPEQDAFLTDASPELRGQAEAGARVVVTLDGEVLCEVEADEAGAFACAPEAALADGAHEAVAVATDALDNASEPSLALTFTIDTTAPEAPVITAPTAGQELEDTTPTFEGTAEANARVQVSLESGEALCEAQADDAGAFACDSAVTLEPGQYSAVAVATDAAELSSAPSAAVAFTVAAPVDDPDDDPDDPDDDPDDVSVPGGKGDGCGCATPARPIGGQSAPLLMLLALGLLVGLRRRR